jgi:lysophospholipid acyltransferase (LPLAT)-like uncharacterized protein
MRYLASLFKTIMKRKILTAIAPILGYLVVRLIYLTCKKQFFIAQKLPDEPLIVAFWHGELLMQPFLYNKVRPNHKVSAMISEHFDGEILARLIGFFGFDTTRGSARKNGAKALLSTFRRMDEGHDIAITPDGPKGPRHSVAVGIVAIAQKKQAKIVVFNYTASSYWELRSWDKFVVPKPFSTLSFYASAPIDIDGLDVEAARLLIREEMLKNACK